MFLFRPHMGSLSSAMEEVIKFKSKDGLVEHITKDLEGFQHGLIINTETVKIVPYAHDNRIDWDSHIVTLDGYGVVGFTDRQIGEVNTHE